MRHLWHQRSTEKRPGARLACRKKSTRDRVAISHGIGVRPIRLTVGHPHTSSHCKSLLIRRCHRWGTCRSCWCNTAAPTTHTPTPIRPWCSPGLQDHGMTRVPCQASESTVKLDQRCSILYDLCSIAYGIHFDGEPQLLATRQIKLSPALREAPSVSSF